ncbi:hypothetical protein KA107_03380 [Candidatus Pacearchaeota archaeon]|nr:hypothetical protein [Candidatus Pacearchaeota archaeon]
MKLALYEILYDINIARSHTSRSTPLQDLAELIATDLDSSALRKRFAETHAGSENVRTKQIGYVSLDKKEPKKYRSSLSGEFKIGFYLK